MRQTVFILNEMLSNWKMNPTVADSAQTALAAINRSYDDAKPFDLVVFDFQMPLMNGFTLAERIRKNPRFAGIKLVMLSSIGQRGDAARCNLDSRTIITRNDDK